jgi:hypothetical protein
MGWHQPSREMRQGGVPQPPVGEHLNDQVRVWRPMVKTVPLPVGEEDRWLVGCRAGEHRSIRVPWFSSWLTDKIRENDAVRGK